MDKENLKNKLLDKFKSLSNIEIVPWVEGQIGLSILKNYPENGKFIPIKTRDGKHDSVALIKICTFVDFSKKISTIPLIVSIEKASRYKLEHYWYNYSDEKSPKKSEVEKSKASIQPIDLEEVERFEFDLQRNTLYDRKKDSFIDPSELIDSIYFDHLDTLSNVVFRGKMYLRTKLLNFIDPTIGSLKFISRYFFGKGFKKSSDMFKGVLRTYSRDDFTDLVMESEKPKILGSDFPITYQSATTFIFFVLVVYLLRYQYSYDLFGLYELIQNAENNNLFLASLTTVGVLIFDRFIPRILFYLINTLIKIKNKLTFLRISI